MVLSTAMHLAKGSLKIRTPEGRLLIVGGNAPGPDAELVLHNWRLPGRAFSGGTIGVAESYMDGDWESPDVTASSSCSSSMARPASRWRAARAGCSTPSSASATG